MGRNKFRNFLNESVTNDIKDIILDFTDEEIELFAITVLEDILKVNDEDLSQGEFDDDFGYDWDFTSTLDLINSMGEIDQLAALELLMFDNDYSRSEADLDVEKQSNDDCMCDDMTEAVTGFMKSSAKNKKKRKFMGNSKAEMRKTKAVRKRAARANKSKGKRYYKANKKKIASYSKDRNKKIKKGAHIVKKRKMS